MMFSCLVHILKVYKPSMLHFGCLIILAVYRCFLTQIYQRWTKMVRQSLAHSLYLCQMNKNGHYKKLSSAFLT